MKTPKRYPATMSVYISSKACFDDRARWKRKNRIARFKDKIARLTAENKWLLEERNKYINFYFNALSYLVKLRENILQQNRKEQK